LPCSNGWKIPELIAPDADAEYAEIIEIDLNEIKSRFWPARMIRMM